MPTAGSFDRRAGDRLARQSALANARDIVPGKQLLAADATALRTAVIDDASNYLRFTNAGATQFLIPLESDVPFPLNTVIEFEQAGAGQVTVATAVGVTVNARGNALKTAGQYAVAALRKVAANTWTLTGDLTA